VKRWHAVAVVVAVITIAAYLTMTLGLHPFHVHRA
jgi:hypothetical protein